MAEVTLLVKAGVMVPAHDRPAVARAGAAVSGNRIETVGPWEELARRYPGAREIGGDRFLLIPGLINGHGHGKGLSDFQRGARDDTLESWILETRKFLPLPTRDDVAFSAARLLKAGVTATMHNHVLTDPAAFEREFDDAIGAYREAGIRVQFNPGVRDRNPFVYGDNAAFLQGLSQEARALLAGPPPPGGLTAENFVGAVRALHGRHDGPLCRVGFGPMAPQWCSEKLLGDVKAAARELGTPIHLHAAQSIYQKLYGIEALGKPLIEYLDGIGFLGPEVVIGHCVWPTVREIDLLARTGTGVTHHPSCNLRVRNGIAPVFEMLGAGVRVGLGADSKSINDDDDLLAEMKVCFLLGRIPSLGLDSAHLSARQVFRMATETNAELLGFGHDLGRIEPGRFADLVLLDYEQMCFPRVDPSHDPVEVLLYRGKQSHVHTVVAGGRVVLENGRLLAVDEEAVGRRLAEAASRPRTERQKALVRAVDELRQAVVRYYRGWPEKVETKPYFAVNSRVDGLKGPER